MAEVNVNNLSIHYEMNDWTSPWLASETIWIQHGFGRSGNFWFHWVPPLCRKYRVIRVDMRGHGQSGDPSESKAWTVDDLLNDVRSVSQALDLGPIHYVGESMGGVLGIPLAARWPELLKRL